MKKYLCQWCNQETKRAHHHLYCEKNPKGRENYELLCKRNKEVYKKYSKKFIESAHTPKASFKRKQSAKNNWDSGVYKNVYSPRFSGKKHREDVKRKVSFKIKQIWQSRTPELVEKMIKRYDIVTPILPSTYHNPYKNTTNKTLVGGEFFEEDFFNYYEED